jgi:hypothetical protein
MDRGHTCARGPAAYGSSGLVEESAQDGDLEERVERHAVVCAHTGRGGHYVAARGEAGCAQAWVPPLLLLCGAYTCEVCL